MTDTIQPTLSTQTDRGREILDAVREIVPLIQRDAPEAEQLGHMTPEVLQALDEAGVFKMCMPPELGGAAVGARDVVEIVSELARGDGSTAWMGFVASGMRMVCCFPQTLVDEIMTDAETWVGPIGIGASVFSTTVGHARAVDGGWMVHGRWAFGSGCKHAQWATVGVEFEHDGHPGRGMALVPISRCTILDDWKVMGLAGTSSNGIAIDEEVFVPAHMVIAIPELDALMAGAAQRYSGLTYQMGTRGAMLAVCLNNVSIALGMAQGALEAFSAQAGKRQPFNLPYPSVAAMPTVQAVAGKARAMINVAGIVIRDHADQVDRRALSGDDFTPAEESEMTMDLVYAVRLCEQAVTEIQGALGSSTVSLKNPIQRHVRDMRVLASHGAIRFDPMAEINGRQVLGLEPFSMFAGGLADVTA